MSASSGSVLAELHEQRAVERSGGAADLHDQRMPMRLQRIRAAACPRASEVGQHGLEAALHVDAVVAVADRLVERRQLVGVAMMVSATARTQPFLVSGGP